MVELYYLDAADITSDVYKELCKTLSQYRVNRANGYLKEEDRLLSLGAGYLLDFALKKRGLCERQAELSFNEYGKPHIEGLHFNLSHSGRFAACALSEGQVGVDVEKLIGYNKKLIDKICTPNEQAMVKTDEQLTRLWVAKESYMKYLGTGFSLPPDKLEIDFTPPLHVKEGGVIKDVVFSEYDLEGYKLTVCAKDKSFPPQKVDLF